MPDLHTGIDIGAPAGWPVLAVLAGTVRATYPDGALDRYGNLVVLRHGPTTFTLYAHLSSIASTMVPGATVQAGQLVGAVGQTARRRDGTPHEWFGPHLHFEMLTQWPPHGIDRDRVDPAPVLRPLGILLEPRSRVRVVAGSLADCAAQRIAAQNGYYVRTWPAIAGAGIGLAGVAIAFFLAAGRSRRRA